ncbi:MAG: hypothetical protein ACOC5T_01915 [Elusimicrobiota bacterium]
MADTGWKYPGTVEEDDTVGNTEWIDINNVKADDGSYAFSSIGGGGGDPGDTKDYSVKLVKGGSITGNEKAEDTALPDGTFGTRTYGNSTDLWGTTLTKSDVEASNFGVVISYYLEEFSTTYYIKATNFGFSIPADATIDGVEVEVEHRQRFEQFAEYADVDYIKMKVYYTDTGGEEEATSLIQSIIIP